MSPQLPDDVPASTLVTVYEAINDTRREIFVGLSMRFMGDVGLSVRDLPELRHWKAGEDVRVRGVEYGVPMRDAWDFLRRYALSRANAGWNVVMPAGAPRADRPA